MPTVYGSYQPTRQRLLVVWEPFTRVNGTIAAFQAGQNGNHIVGSTTYNANAVLAPSSGYVQSLGSRIYTGGPSGTLTSQIYKNGVAVASATLQTTSSQLSSTTFASTVCPFVAGDTLSIFMSTSSWNQVAGGIYVEMWGYV